MAIDELYLDNLDEFINDENKVVTYKWLSRSIGVHVNQAKQMLHTFVQQQRNKKNNDSLCVTYLLAGTQKPDDISSGVTSHKVCIVPEEQLDATKSRMTQVTSCHVYSVQQSRLKDSHSLYTADYDLLKEHTLTSNQHSAITCKAAIIRTSKELEGLRKRGAEAYAPSYQAKAVTGSAKSTKKHQQGAIGAMFGKAAAKETAKLTENKPQEKDAQAKETKADQKQVKKVGGGIASMFAKQSAKPKSEPKKVEEEVEVMDVEMKEDVEVVKEDPKEPTNEEPKKTPKKLSPEPKKATAVKSKKNSDKHAANNGNLSKRRRIKQMEVSSSSEDEIDEVPPTPPREPTPEPSPVASPEPVRVESEEDPEKEKGEKELKETTTAPASNGRRRKRQRKRFAKTFIDDDGFMVTEKVWESESCTDASDIEEPKAKKTQAPKPKEQPKPEQKPTKKKPSPNKITGKKQQSLMSFFKKK